MCVRKSERTENKGMYENILSETLRFKVGKILELLE